MKFQSRMRQAAIVLCGFAIAAMVFGIAGAGPLYAQTVQPVKLAVLDAPRIEQEAVVWQDLRDKFKSANDAVLGELREIQNQLQKEGQDLQQQQAILSSEAFNQRRLEYEAKVQQSNQLAQTRRQDLEKALVQARQQIFKHFRTIVVEISEEQGLNLILDRSSGDATIVFASSEIEITEEIIRRLDQRISTVEFKLAPSQ